MTVGQRKKELSFPFEKKRFSQMTSRIRKKLKGEEVNIFRKELMHLERI